MDLTPSEEQQEIAALAARILSDRMSDDSLRVFARSGEPFDRDLWRTLAEAGLLGIALPESAGGSGFGMMELGMLLEQQGRTLAPLPLAATLAMGALPVAAFGTAAQQALLPAVARGEAILTAALEEAGNPDPMRPRLRAARDGDGWVLDGEKTAIPYGMEAARIIVPASTGAEILLFLVDPEAPGVLLEAQRSTGMEPQAHLALREARFGPDDVLGRREGAEVLRFIVDHMRAALAALQVGICSEALRRTAAYSSERIQFGRPIGSMQAPQHRIADGFIDVEAMRSTAMRAAWLLDAEIPASAEIAVAKYWAAIGGHRVGHSAQHLHGGIGADVEYPIHRYFLAAKQVAMALGGAQPLLAEIGGAIARGETRPLSGVAA